MRKPQLVSALVLLFALPIAAVACSESPTAVRHSVPGARIDCTVLPPPDTAGCTITGGGTAGSGNRYCC